MATVYILIGNKCVYGNHCYSKALELYSFKSHLSNYRERCGAGFSGGAALLLVLGLNNEFILESTKNNGFQHHSSNTNRV